MGEGSVERNNKDTDKKMSETGCGKRKKKQEEEDIHWQEDDKMEWRDTEGEEREWKEEGEREKHVKIHF